MLLLSRWASLAPPGFGAGEGGRTSGVVSSGTELLKLRLAPQGLISTALGGSSFPAVIFVGTFSWS